MIPFYSFFSWHKISFALSFSASSSLRGSAKSLTLHVFSETSSDDKISLYMEHQFVLVFFASSCYIALLFSVFIFIISRWVWARVTLPLVLVCKGMQSAVSAPQAGGGRAMSNAQHPSCGLENPPPTQLHCGNYQREGVSTHLTVNFLFRCLHCCTRISTKQRLILWERIRGSQGRGRDCLGLYSCSVE